MTSVRIAPIQIKISKESMQKRYRLGGDQVSVQRQVWSSKHLFCKKNIVGMILGGLHLARLVSPSVIDQCSPPMREKLNRSNSRAKSFQNSSVPIRIVPNDLPFESKGFHGFSSNRTDNIRCDKIYSPWSKYWPNSEIIASVVAFLKCNSLKKVILIVSEYGFVYGTKLWKSQFLVDSQLRTQLRKQTASKLF